MPSGLPESRSPPTPVRSSARRHDTRRSGRVAPGFNLLLGPACMPNVVLDALHSVTDVRVLSNPSLVVLDNQPATLQVGDQVPISTGTATVLTANNTVVSTIDYMNTGVILRVAAAHQRQRQCRARRRAGNLERPPGRRRATTPDADDLRPQRQELDLGGQRPDRAARRADQRRSRPHAPGIPVLDKLPGIGDLFSQQSGTKARTELIIFIRPTVIRDPVDARMCRRGTALQAQWRADRRQFSRHP